MYISDTRLKSFLSDAGLVSQKAFSEAENEAKKHSVPVGDILKAHNVIGEDELRRTYAYILGIPFVSLAGTDIRYETLSLIPEPVARRNNIIAYAHHGNELEVAMLDTDDLAAIDSIKKKTQLKILPRLTDVLSIKHALKLYQKGLKDNLGDVIERETTLLEKGGEMKDEDLHKIASGASAVRIVDTLLRHASAQGASDIHIEPEETSLLIRYRIDGILRDSISGFTLESIGFHGNALERMHEAMRATTGMILACGPTGAGKSTTLYTLLDMVNKPQVNISTLEDPFGYQIRA